MSNAVSRQTTDHVPEPVARVADLMGTFGGAWCLSGGWAVDAWLGRLSREHADVDIAVFLDDSSALLDHLTGWQLVAHDTQVDGGTAEPWNGRPLVLPAHIHARSAEAGLPLPDRVDNAAGQGFGLDIQFNERSGGDWIFSREPRIAMPLRRAVRQSAWGLPTLVPEVILFYKASGGRDPLLFLRRRDRLDFLALLPQLTEGQRDWLRNAISLVGHPWLPQLTG